MERHLRKMQPLSCQLVLSEQYQLSLHPLFSFTPPFLLWIISPSCFPVWSYLASECCFKSSECLDQQGDLGLPVSSQASRIMCLEFLSFIKALVFVLLCIGWITHCRSCQCKRIMTLNSNCALHSLILESHILVLMIVFDHQLSYAIS